MTALRDRYDDTTMFLRCFGSTLRTNLQNAGVLRGLRWTYWCGLWGVELQREYRDAERAGLLTPLNGSATR